MCTGQNTSCVIRKVNLAAMLTVRAQTGPGIGVSKCKSSHWEVKAKVQVEVGLRINLGGGLIIRTPFFATCTTRGVDVQE